MSAVLYIRPERFDEDNPPHLCGNCRTPWGVTNPECPGAIRDQRKRWLAEIDAFEFHA
jgi:hypothetical protein